MSLYNYYGSMYCLFLFPPQRQQNRQQSIPSNLCLFCLLACFALRRWLLVARTGAAPRPHVFCFALLLLLIVLFAAATYSAILKGNSYFNVNTKQHYTSLKFIVLLVQYKECVILYVLRQPELPAPAGDWACRGGPALTANSSTATSYMFGDNKSVVDSSAKLRSRLHKRHNALSCHHVREAAAAKVVRLCHIAGDMSPADILSKHWGHQQIWPVLRPTLFWQGDTMTIHHDQSPLGRQGSDRQHALFTD